MRSSCPQETCTGANPPSKIGFYVRKSDSRRIQRYRCPACRKEFSSATFDLRYRQKKRFVNQRLERLLVSGVSQRRAALLLRVHRVTVARKFKFLAMCARADHLAYIDERKVDKIREVQFDDVETSESSRLKPLSITIAVEGGGRKFLAIRVSEMRAKGPQAAASRAKYGYRKDRRPQALEDALRSLSAAIAPDTTFKSDSSSYYRQVFERVFPHHAYHQVLSRRARVQGFGELKKGGWDQLFSLNHTAAMLRANINRLARRTWCTTKKATYLEDHLFIYARFHNRVLTARTRNLVSHLK